MIRYTDEWYEPPNDDEERCKPWRWRQRKQREGRVRWRPLRLERPRRVVGFGR